MIKANVEVKSKYWYKKIKNPKKYFISNVLGTLNMLEAAKKAKVKKFIYAASASCYGIPNRFPTNEDAKINLIHPYLQKP